MFWDTASSGAIMLRGGCSEGVLETNLENDMIEHYHATLVECFRKNGVVSDKIIRFEEVLINVEERRSVDW